MYANVVSTLHSDDACHCVKIMREPDGTFGFREYRRDPEDAGGWTMVRDNGGAFATPQQAVTAAAEGIAWLAEKQSKVAERG